MQQAKNKPYRYGSLATKRRHSTIEELLHLHLINPKRHVVLVVQILAQLRIGEYNTDHKASICKQGGPKWWSERINLHRSLVTATIGDHHNKLDARAGRAHIAIMCSAMCLQTDQGTLASRVERRGRLQSK